MAIKEPQIFDSWDSFVTRAEERPGRDGVYGSETFCLTPSFESAVELARHGWGAMVAEAETVASWVEDKVELERFAQGFRTVPSVCGQEVDVARYLGGDPECMIDSLPVQISKHGRAVRLIVPVGYLAAVSANTAVKRGAAILALVDLLKRAGHPCEIWATSFADPTHTRTARFFGAIRVQRADQPIDVGQLAFALAHPSTFRRLMFAIREQTTMYPDGGGASATMELTQEAIDLLPEAEGNEIRLPTLTPGDNWSPEASVAWIETQLALIFD